MNYIRRHWNGELPLITAFWVNVFFLGFLLRLIEVWLGQSTLLEHPVTSAQIAVAYFVFAVFVAYPWQVVGAWRSADRYSKESNSGVWGGVVRVFVVLGVLGTAVNLSVSLPVYGVLFKMGFVQDDYADYTFSVTDDGSLIHLKGGLGFGVSEDFADFLPKYDGVTGVILDSRGGRIYEGRQLAKIILENELNTYTLAGCYSACGTAFMAGNRRYLGTGSNLAFHQYAAPGENLGLYFDTGTEQEKDLQIYRRQGVSEDFLERIFLADQDDLWYPTVDELLSANVVHEIISVSDVTPAGYSDVEIREMLRTPALDVLKKYDRNAYDLIRTSLEEQIENGASRIDIQETLGDQIDVLANESIGLTSNRALINFAKFGIDKMEKLGNVDPILCVKYIFPGQFGPIDFSKHSSKEDSKRTRDVFNQMIIDRYELPPPTLDVAAAEKMLDDVVFLLLGDEYYLDAGNLKGGEDYAKACGTAKSFYKMILGYSENDAGNVLRYVMSE